MITRVKTGAVLMLLGLLFLYIRGTALNILIIVGGLAVTYEMMKVYQIRKPIPKLIRLLVYALVLVTVVSANVWSNLYPLMYGSVIVLGIIGVLYRDSKVFSIIDLSYLSFSYMFIAGAFSGAIFLNNEFFEIFVFAIIIAICADTFGYFGGNLFGKNKLIPEISPNKTIEGAISATLMSTIIGTTYLYFLVNENHILVWVIISFITGIISQFGDLFASMIKREFKAKDFSNIFPGHGGVLDRLDGILFNIITLRIIIELFAEYF